MNDFIQRVDAMQKCGLFHPFTCKNDSKHELLYGSVINGQNILICPTCKSIQKIDNIILPSLTEIHLYIENYKNLFKGNQ